MKCSHGGVKPCSQVHGIAEICDKVGCVQSPRPKPALPWHCQQPTSSCRSRNLNVLSYKLTNHGKLRRHEWQMIYQRRVDCLKLLQSLCMAGFYGSILRAVCHKRNEIKTVD